MESDKVIPLSEGVDRYRSAGGPSKAYDWYRKSAQRDGTVWMGHRIPVDKVQGRWLIKESDVLDAIEVSRRAADYTHQVSDDYANHILHGNDGDTIETTWGHYLRRKGLHFHFDRVMSYRKRSDGWWICSTCWTPATLKHDNPECHTCADWGGCGRDCTLSGVTCTTCGTRLGTG